MKETHSKKFEEYKILSQIKIWRIKASGDDGVEETLLSIPNRTVKLYSANGTAWETVWESRTLPGKCGSIAQSVEQRTENPRVPGSIPGRATRKKH